MTAPSRPPSRSFGRVVAPFVALVLVMTGALIVFALVVPGRAALALRWFLVVVGAIAVMAAMRAIAERYSSHSRLSFDPLARPPADPTELPRRLREIDRLVANSAWNPNDFEERLRPILRAIATQRLATYRSIVISNDPESARAVLGEEVWSLIAPGDQVPDQRERGVDVGELRAVVATLEGLDAIPHD